MDNICKFIIPREEITLKVKNFYFENKSPERDGCTANEYRVYLVSGGHGRLKMGAQNAELFAGTLFFTVKSIPFSILSDGDLSYYCMCFEGTRADELIYRFSITPAYSTFAGFEGLLPLWRDSIVRANDENIDLLCESLILYAFSRLKREGKEEGKLVSVVLSYLEKNFTRHDLSLKEVAQAAGYNEKYLSHVFKQRFGMGFSEYLRLLRIKHAVMLIEHGLTTVKNVAFLSGFSDPLYFSKVFTEIVGTSPSKYNGRAD